MDAKVHSYLYVGLERPEMEDYIHIISFHSSFLSLPLLFLFHFALSTILWSERLEPRSKWSLD